MLEVHDVKQGPVYEDCSCNATGTTPLPKQTLLDPKCYSPSGSDCSWYTNCLEKRFICSGTKYNYAIGYARKFCNLYSAQYSNFGQAAQSWIDATRKCLQVKLVSFLRPWVKASCEDIYSATFGTHSGCYLAPQIGSISICQLSCSDLWKIFWLVYDGGAVYSAPRETAKQMLEVAVGCLRARGLNDITCLSENVQRLVNFGVAVKSASAVLSTKERVQEFGGRMANYLVAKFSWKERGLDWLPFSNDDFQSTKQKRSASETHQFNVQVLLVDRSSLNVSQTTPSAGANTLEKVVSEVVSAVQSGSLSEVQLAVDGMSVSAGVSDFGRCRSVECNGTALEVSVEAPSMDAPSMDAPSMNAPSMNAPTSAGVIFHVGVYLMMFPVAFLM